jgi:hypothetical protein
MKSSSKELREAVLEVAKRGSKTAGRTGRRRNPLYVPPTPEQEAWSHVYGECRAFVEWATPEKIEAAISGLRSADYDQSSNIEAVRECGELIQVIAEKIKSQAEARP